MRAGCRPLWNAQPHVSLRNLNRFIDRVVARWTSIRRAALSMLGRHDEAMRAFDELLRLEPDFFERWPELAARYELSRRETEAGS